MTFIYLMNKVLSNIFLGSLSFSTQMDFKVSLVCPCVNKLFLKGQILNFVALHVVLTQLCC